MSRARPSQSPSIRRGPFPGDPQDWAILSGALGKIVKSTTQNPSTSLGTATTPPQGHNPTIRLHLAPDTTFHTQHLNTTHKRRLPCPGVETQCLGQTAFRLTVMAPQPLLAQERGAGWSQHSRWSSPSHKGSAPGGPRSWRRCRCRPRNSQRG